MSRLVTAQPRVKNLQDATEAELLAALDQKRKIKKATPAPLSQPDFTGLIDIVAEGVKEMVKEEYEDDDFRHYVYEAAMTAIYGNAYWTWRNNVNWR